MTSESPTNIESRLTAHEHRWLADWNYQTVYHIGDLDDDRSRPHHSQEGKELSIAADQTVSDAWKRIAHVGGTTYKLTNPDAVFYNIDPNTSVTDAEFDYCVENDYISVTDAFRVDDYDGDKYMLFYDRETAESEAGGLTADATVSETTAPVLADRGREYWTDAFTQHPDKASPVGIRLLIPIWAASALAVNGVYWHHPLEPYNHSAPRGLIFQENLSEWNIEVIE